MKKRRWLLPVCIMIGALVLCAASAFWCFNVRGYGFTVGRCLVADNGSYILVAENSPIVMSNRTDHTDLFSGLSTGDRILVLHDGVQETYPGGTGVYACLRVSGGDSGDISENVMDALRELGWRFGQDGAETAEKTETKPPDNVQTVSHSRGYANMTLYLPAGWEYSLEEYTQENAGADGFGINFRPADRAVGSITLTCYNSWGVCGTGLKQELAIFENFDGWVGTYDDREVWDFISTVDLPGNYVFLNTGAESWWEEYGGEAMWIIENAVLAEGIMTKEQAVALALAEAEGQGVYEAGYCSFDLQTGIWEINLNAINNTGEDHTVHVFPDETTETVELPIP